MHLDLALPPRGRTSLLEAIRRWADRAPQGLRLIGGDWNSVPPDETRMTGDGGEARNTDRTGEHFERLFEDYTEIFRPDFMWSRRLASGVETTRSRIDRLYAGVD